MCCKHAAPCIHTTFQPGAKSESRTESHRFLWPPGSQACWARRSRRSNHSTVSAPGGERAGRGDPADLCGLRARLALVAPGAAPRASGRGTGCVAAARAADGGVDTTPLAAGRSGCSHRCLLRQCHPGAHLSCPLLAPPWCGSCKPLQFCRSGISHQRQLSSLARLVTAVPLGHWLWSRSCMQGSRRSGQQTAGSQAAPSPLQ